MNELDDLYQEILLDHYRRPRNFGPLPGADREVDAHNPLCGDRLHLAVRLEGDRLADIRFEGSGCAISTASASMMTEAVKGLSTGEVLSLTDRFRALVMDEKAQAAVGDLGELAALGGVRAFPMRVKCATLAWHALRSALAGDAAPVTTE
jgi:nitrogen fixation NifU-like protein